MHKSKIIQIFIILIYLTNISHASDFSLSELLNQNENDTIQNVSIQEDNVYYLDPTDQKGITEALSKHKHVHLRSGEYLIDDSILINSNNILSGESDAVIRVKSTSSQFFQGKKGLIYTDVPVDNVEIYGFKIDGNCDKLPFEYHRSRSDTAHDCQQAIRINGQTGRFSTNIKIHDMQIENCFSDGIHVRFAEGVHCYNNFISNCQHEGIFWVSVKEGIAENNKIAGITSDCFRTDNGVNNLIQNNYFFSYTGDKNNQAPKGYQKGIQIADAGASHGYDASKKPTSTTNIEVKGNVFANTGSKSVWLDSTGKGYDNVFIHDNKFMDVEVFTNPGKSVNVKIKPTNEATQTFIDLTKSLEPTKETSKSIFDSIFNILSIKYTNTGITNQTEESSTISIKETEKGRITGGIKIIGFKDLVYIDGNPYIPTNESILVKYNAFQTPFDEWFNGGVSNITKDVKVRIENGTAKATLDVKLKWFTVKTGANEKKVRKYHITKATFNDSCPAPSIYPSPRSATVYIDIYTSPYRNYTLVSVDSVSQQRNEFCYRGNIITNTHMIGEQSTDKNGLTYTNFYSVDMWSGNLSNYGNYLYIENETNPENISVKVYSVYKEIPTKTEVNYHEWDGESTTKDTKFSLVKIGIMIFVLFKLLKFPFKH